MVTLRQKIIACQLALILGASAQAETLKEAVEVTIKSNPNVLASANSRLATDQELEQAKGGYLPTVDLNAGWGWEESENPSTRANGDGTIDMERGEAGILLRQMIFDGFATKNEVKRQTASVNSAAHSVDNTTQSISLRTAEVYLEYLRRSALTDLAQTNLDAHQKTYDQIKKRSERGIGRKADLDQAEGRLALAKSNLMAEQSNLREAEINYVRVIGHSPVDLSDPEMPAERLPVSLETAVDQAKDGHPALKVANADIEAALAQHKASKSTNLPRLDLEIGATQDHDLDGVRGGNEDTTAMLRMRYNIFNGFRDQARQRETAHLINEAKEIRNRVCRQVVENMRLSWNQYNTVNSQLAFFEQHVKSSEQALEAYKKQFNIGQRTLLDVLDQENEVFVARTAYVNGKYDQMFSIFRILEAKGELLASLGVEKPGETATIASK